MFYVGFEYRLILSMFYVCFRVSFDTQYVLFLVSRYHLILDMFYITFQGYCFGVFMVIVCKAPVSLTSVFKTCYSPNLERADFDNQSFQDTWLNSYFFGSLRESSKTQTYLAFRNKLVVAISEEVCYNNLVEASGT